MKLLVIDVQNAVYTPALYAYDAFTENLVQLILTARKTGTEVIFVRHNDGAGSPLSPGNPGFEIAAPFAPIAGSPKNPNIRIGSTTALNSVLDTCM